MNWHSVKTWRSAGVDAKWGRWRGRPAMFVKPSHSDSFVMLTEDSLECITYAVDHGTSLKQAVDDTMSLCDVFSIPV